MAERKAVNKYYPPDWDPSKQGSVNKRVGQHPLRDRARKLSQGILIIRFELPYNIWCDGCNNPVGMGVRYNAEKKKVGNYYSTPIYKFRMKCHLCDSHFEIQTDPKNHDYVVVSGARRKEQRWDPHQNEQIVPEDKATQKKLATDAMYKLEHGSDDQQKSRLARPSLGQLQGQRGQWKDDYQLNKLARNKFRAEKKAIETQQSSDKNLLIKSSLDIDLVEEREEDIQLAGLLKYKTVESFDERQKQKRKEIECRPLFGSSGMSQRVTSPSQLLDNNKVPADGKIEEQKKRFHVMINNQTPSPFSERLQKSSAQPSVIPLIVKKKSLPLKTSKEEKDLDSPATSHLGHQQKGSSPSGLRRSNQNQQSDAWHSLISEYGESDESGSDS